ncbi:unnamed protein product [Ectocarpus fasciculatus]
METLIPVVNKLQDVMGAVAQVALDLPQIVVIGSQSSGKSSVIESLVGRDFLPRGSGIVTRRPLILQLYCTAGAAEDEVLLQEDMPEDAEWGEFLHRPGEKFFNFEDIRAEIERETDRITGTNKGISKQSINLRVFSPHVLNLTLVDLPGITKVPIGDQPTDIEELIRSMCCDFISNPNAIILAVTAANQDLANSDGLKMARSVDPSGERTLGVLTKVDIMDAGTDASEILSNKVIPLKMGYIAVVNRSQADINKNLSVREGNAKEKQYFAKHSGYRMSESRCGTHNLARILNQLLVKHIKEVLPDIKAKISQMVKETEANLASLGEGTDSLSQSQLVGFLLQIISKFSSNFRDKLEARSNSSNINVDELSGGARITYVFKEIYCTRLASFLSLDGMSDDHVRTAIANANGLRPAMMMPEQAFDLLIRKEILRLEAPSIQCLEFIYDELLRMVSQSFPTEMKRYPNLKDRVSEIVHGHLRNLLGPAQAMIKNLIAVELAYLNTSHPDYISSGKAVAEANNILEMSKPRPAAQEKEGPSTHHTSHPMSPVAGSSSNSVPAANNPRALNVASGAVTSAKPNGEQPKSGTAPKKTVADSSLIKLSAVPDCISKSSVAPTDREKLEMLTIRIFVDSYFNIVKKNVTDLVPKTIMHFLVNSFRDSLADHLNVELHSVIGYKDSDLLREKNDVSEQRAQFREIRDMLHKALEIVNEVRDFNIS